MCLLVAFNWNNTSNAGVWSANWNNTRDNSNNNVGFRADCGSFLKPHPGDRGAIGICYPALGEIIATPLFGRETEDQRKIGI